MYRVLTNRTVLPDPGGPGPDILHRDVRDKLLQLLHCAAEEKVIIIIQTGVKQYQAQGLVFF